MKKLLLFFSLFLVCIGLSGQTFTFTPAGAVGNTGPTQSQVDAAYSGTNLAGQVTVNGGIQYWVVPQTGTYRITALGGQGYGSFGGRGASITGDFTLTAGDTLKILVGQEAPIYPSPSYDHQFGGGGGSFITTINNSPLIVAGGGGGNHGTSHSASNDGQITTAGAGGTNGSTTGAGGTGGMGGAAASSADGGGGLLGNGAGLAGGKAFVNGGVGGADEGIGGFGCGGGTSSWNNYRAGGGGGYSGGGAANNGGTCCPTGGGGGSYNAGTNPVDIAGVQTGDGQVIIDVLSSGATNDIGAISLDAPMEFCPGSQTVIATIQNFGTNVVNSGIVNWSVNGVNQSPFSFSGTLDTIGGSGSPVAQVTLGTYTFAAGATYNIQVSTSQPNGVTDTVPSNDTYSAVVTTGLPAPSNFSVSNVLSSTADLTWATVANAVNYNVIYGPAGFNPASAGTMQSTTNNMMSLTGLTGNTNYDAYVYADCGSPGTSLDTAGPISFLTLCSAVLAPYTEDFETGYTAGDVGPNINPCFNSLNTTAPRWEVEDATGANENSGSTGPFYDNTNFGTAGGFYLYLETSGGSAGMADTLTSPLIDISPLTNPFLQFAYHMYGGTMGSLEVEYWNGSAWSMVGTITGQQQTAGSDPWNTYGVALGSIAGNFTQIRFTGIRGSSFTGDMSLDDISVVEAPPCPDPAMLTFVGSTSNSATVSWTDGVNSTWNLEVGPTGFAQGTGTLYTTSNNPYTIGGLNPSSSYDVYLRADCSAGGNGTSSWIGPLTVVTQCNVFTAPFAENFDGASWVASGNNANNQIDICWTADPDPSQGAEPFKWIPRNNGPSSGNGPLNDVTGGNFMYVEASSSSAGDIARLTTPMIDVSNLTTPALYFYQHRYSNGSIADMDVEVSNDNGSTWNVVYSVSGDIQTSSSDPWTLEFVNLASYTNDTIQVRFVQIGNGCCGDAAIDSVTVDEAPACPWPTALGLAATTSTSATISWNDPSGSNWDIEIGPSGFSQGTGTVTSTSTNPSTVTGLQPNTTYDVYVRTDCGTNGTSIWIGPLTFTTQCAPFTAPYYNDFESDQLDVPPTCWFEFETTSNSFVEVENFTGTAAPYSGLQALYLYNSNATSSDTLMAITPNFSDMTAGDKQVRFFANSDGPATQLIVGTVSNPLQPQSFVALDTITFPTPDTYQEVIVQIDSANGYNGTHQYVALRHSMGPTFNYIRIDEFNYELIPACPKITALQVTSTTTNSANVTFNTNGGTLFEYEWGPTGFMQGTGTTGTITGSPATIGGMTAAQTYDLYIRVDCGTAGYSVWEGPVTFTTQCAVLSLPYYESFDNWPLTCWDSTGGSEYWAPYNGPGSDRYAVADFWSSSTGTYKLTTGDLDITQQAQVRFSWSHLASTSYPDDQLYVFARPVGSANWDTIAHYRAGDGNFNDPSAANTAPGNFIEDVHVLPSSYVGDTIEVQLYGISDFGPNAYINNFYVEIAPSCVPTSLGDINAGIALGDSLSIYWTPGQGFEWQVEIGVPGFTPGLQSGIDSTRSSDTIEGFGNLTPNTTYEFYLRDSCAVGGWSPWTGPFTMTTGCANLVPMTLPFTDGFETYTGPVTATGSFHCGPDFTWSFENPGGNGELEFVYSPISGPSAPFNGNQSAGLTSQNSSIPVYLILTVDMTNYINSPNGIQLSYMFADHLDETGAEDKVWIRGSMTDSWIEILDWNSKNATTNWKGDTVFMDQILAANNQTFSNTTQVRWGQMDNAAMTGGDGFSVDDVVIEEITCPNPTALTAAPVGITTAGLSWSSVGSANSYEIWYGPTGFFQGTQTSGGTKVYSTTNSYSLSGLSAASCYDFYVRAICGTGDTSSLSGPRTFCTNCNVFAAPYVETFDSAGWVGSGTNLNNQIDVCWSSTPDVSQGTEPFKWIPRNSGPSSGNGPLSDVTGGNFMYVEASGSSTGDVASLTSPLIDVSGLNVPIMYFYQHRYNTNASIADMMVEVSNDNGLTWTQEYMITGVTQTASGAPWEEITVNLAAYAGDTIMVKFTQVGKGCCGDAAIDYLRIVETPTCFRPDSLTATNIGLTSADIGWVTGGATNWQILYGPSGFTPGGAGSTWVGTSTNPTTLSALLPSTTYDVYVRDSCGPGDVSFWEGPLTFSTLCGVATAPFFENFDGGSWVSSGSNANNQINSCWSSTPNVTMGTEPFKWIPRNNGPSSGNGPLNDVTGGNFMYVEASGSSTGDVAHLTTPPIDLGTLAGPVMYFNQHRYNTNANIADMDVYVSNDNGASWTIEYSITGITQASSSAPWDTIMVDLAPYQGDTVLIRFTQTGKGCCGDAAIDNIQIVDNVSCPAPTALAATNVACASADLNWTGGGTTSWIEYGPAGFAPGTGAGTIMTGNSPMTISGLMPGTNYEFYVVDICGSDTSMPAGPVAFTTATGPLMADFTFNLGTATATELPVTFDGSPSQGANLYIWNFGDTTPVDTGMSLVHNYLQNGVYNVTLIIEGPCGTDTIMKTVIITGVSLEESGFARSLSLYPNPTSSILKVEFDAPANQVELRLSSIEGKLIQKFSDQAASGDTYRTELNLSNLPKGVYLLEIRSGDEYVHRRVSRN